jgi:Na+-driven multidrug efflux pump
VGVAGRIADLAFMPIVGTAHGLLPIIGFSLGARLWARLWKAVRLASAAMALLMAIATIFLEVFTAQLVGLFTRDAALIAIAVPGMRIFLSTMVLIGPTIMFITTFQGLSKGKDALVLSLARQFIFFVPALYGLTHVIGLTGVWLSMPFSDIMGALTSGLWLLREYRRQKKDPAWVGPQAGSQFTDADAAAI